MQAICGSFALLCFVTIFGEICIEKYKEFNGVNFSSTRARPKVLAGSARKHCVIETQKPIRGSTFLDPNHSLNHGLNIDNIDNFI